ncbi:hypothetical protein BS50DRAFT_593441 [Corynespora cassiicola Philippines]|uniref:Uncharacterized protein n=1 Tax=Corynespora cassiicola Philippines TaxID=1448308 RepID=A0A2T2N5G9_CORCC|nr:hypothetical protein BS50DRAFT_593441 [Corynespora cassiicola Philippines]
MSCKGSLSAREIEINYAKLASLAGYTEASASVTIGKIKRKLKALTDGPTLPASTKTTPSTASRKKAPSSTTKGSASKPKSTAGTPTKNAKAKRSRLASDDEDMDEEFRNVRVKREEERDLLAGASDSFNRHALGLGVGDGNVERDGQGQELAMGPK